MRIVYTDGSFKHKASWAWCCGEEVDYGIDLHVDRQNNLSAEFLSVLNAVRSLKGNLLIVNDCPYLLRFFQGKPYNCKSHVTKSCRTIWNEIEALKSGRYVQCVLPSQKDKGRHRWCHKVAKEMANTIPYENKFDKEWKGSPQHKKWALLEMLNSRITTKGKPPREDINEILDLIDIDYYNFYPIEV